MASHVCLQRVWILCWHQRDQTHSQIPGLSSAHWSPKSRIVDVYRLQKRPPNGHWNRCALLTAYGWNAF